MKNADHCFLKQEVTTTRLVLSTIQRYSVYYDRGVKKARRLHLRSWNQRILLFFHHKNKCINQCSSTNNDPTNCCFVLCRMWSLRPRVCPPCPSLPPLTVWVTWATSRTACRIWFRHCQARTPICPNNSPTCQASSPCTNRSAASSFFLCYQLLALACLLLPLFLITTSSSYINPHLSSYFFTLTVLLSC